MFNFCKDCAIQARKSNNISELPIPIYAIEQIIIDLDYDIVIIPTLRKSCVFDQTLFVANLPDTEFRISLAHELGHILMHDFFLSIPAKLKPRPMLLQLISLCLQVCLKKIWNN